MLDVGRVVVMMVLWDVASGPYTLEESMGSVDVIGRGTTAVEDM